MKHVNISIDHNPYFSSPEVTALIAMFNIQIPKNMLTGLENIHYFNLLLGYTDIILNSTDLFQFLNDENINQLRNDSNTMLFFDCTFEGFGKQDLVIAQCLENNAVKYGINPKKIFFFTGNLQHINANINVIPTYILHQSFVTSEIKFSLNESRALCEKNLNKQVLSLSRRNRSHRVMAHFMLFKSKIFHNCLISQDRLEPEFDKIDPTIVAKMNCNYDDFMHYRNSLPMLVDGNVFHINSPFDPLIEVHSKTVFSIVNETHASNYDDTSLFFSEKILKPMINFQPMLIYGQPGINKKLNILGFKSYESYFDLSFDDEPDDIYRYQKLLISACEAVSYLESLSKEQQVEWRYKNTELLQYNYNQVIYLDALEGQISKFINLVKQII